MFDTTPSTSTILLTLTLGMSALGCETEGYDEIFDELDASAELDEEFAPAIDGAFEVDGLGPEAMPTAANAHRRGRVDFGTFNGTRCETVTFASPFSTADANIRIQASVDHRQPGNFDAVTLWVEDITATGAELCVRETRHFNGNHVNDGLHVSYWAFRKGGVQDNGRLAMAHIPENDNGRRCEFVPFNVDYDSAPIVNVTITHPEQNGLGEVRDPSSVWVDQILIDDPELGDGFNVCFREDAGYFPGHVPYAIDWVAFPEDAQPAPASGVAGTIAASDYLSGSSFSDQYCQYMSFDANTFSETPDVFLTATHDDAIQHNSGTTWVENLTADGFRACYKELAFLSAQDPTTSNNTDSNHTTNLVFMWTALSAD